MTDTETKAAAPEATPEQKALRQTVLVVARALMKLEGKGTRDEMKARWDGGRAKYTGDARKLVKSLEKDGVTFTINEAETPKARRMAKKAKAETEGGEA